MQHLNTPPRPTLTAFEPRSSAVGSAWLWSVLGTSGPTFQSTPSQETALSTEVRQIQFCRQFQVIILPLLICSLFFLCCQFWTRIQRKAMTPNTWPKRFSRQSVKGTTTSFWRVLCPRWPFTCAHCGPRSSSNSWLLMLARSKNLKKSDTRNSRAWLEMLHSG